MSLGSGQALSRAVNIFFRDYEKLREPLGFNSYYEVRTYHERWVSNYMRNGKNTRDDKWTRSIAVGTKGFVEKVKSLMGVMAIGRKSIKAGESYQLREPSTPPDPTLL